MIVTFWGISSIHIRSTLPILTGFSREDSTAELDEGAGPRKRGGAEWKIGLIGLIPVWMQIGIARAIGTEILRAHQSPPEKKDCDLSFALCTITCSLSGN